MDTTPAPLSKYHTVVTRFELVGPDGATLNYSVTPHMLASGYLARQPEGAALVVHHDQRECTAADRLLIDSDVPAEHWPLLHGDARRMTNMVPGQRYSDSMRSAIRAFLGGTMGIH